MRRISVTVFTATLVLVLVFSIAMVQQVIVMPPQPAAQTQKAPVTWAKTYGNTSEDIAMSVAATPDGGCIVVGKTNSFGSGDYDFWVLKLDSNGTIQWQKAYGGTGEDVALSVAVAGDGDGYAVAGYTNSLGASSYDFWVLKLNSTGGVEWQKSYGGASFDYAYSVTFDSEGKIVVAGYSNSFGSGDYDFCVLKLDPATGNITWQFRYGASGTDDVARGIAFAGDGYVVAGYTKSFGASDEDVWVIKLNMDGTLQWQNVYKNPGIDYALSVAVAGDGYVVAGYTNSSGYWNGDHDFLFLKLNSTGEVQWVKKYGRPGVEWACSIAVASDGYILAGHTNSFGAGGEDFLVMKIDQSGTIKWQRTYGGLKNDKGYSAVVHADGYITVVGETSSFDVNGTDFWVLRLNSSGAIANPIQEFTIRDGSAEAKQLFFTNESTGVTAQQSTFSQSSITFKTVDTFATVKEQAPPTPEGGGAPPGGAPTEGGVEGWMITSLWLMSGAGAPSTSLLIGAVVVLAVAVTGVLLWRFRLRAKPKG
ncbi:MAG: hypothetical protein QXN15_08415 [Candidatus Jordarchaeales archaeon]